MFPVWDVPTRLFHWSLVLAVIVSWISQEEGYFQVHQWSGYTVLVLVVFRMVWGMVGSVHSRFADFLAPPGRVLAYLRGGLHEQPGHNPAGGWSVLAMLALLLLQALTGLFNSDGLIYDGPFHHALSAEWTDRLGAWHETVFWFITALIGLHVAAVLYYQFSRQQALVVPMINGGGSGKAAPESAWRAAAVVASCALLLALALYYAPEPVLYW